MIEKVSKLGLALLGMLCIPVAVQGETVPVGPISMLSQQDGQISGVVSDKAGPVIGASVIVKGTTNGITTDMDGRFSLAGLKKGDVIQIVYRLCYAGNQIYRPSICRGNLERRCRSFG